MQALFNAAFEYKKNFGGNQVSIIQKIAQVNARDNGQIKHVTSAVGIIAKGLKYVPNKYVSAAASILIYVTKGINFMVDNSKSEDPTHITLKIVEQSTPND
jgi:hypothetical protein